MSDTYRSAEAQVASPLAEPPKLDLHRLGALLGIAETSQHEPEALTALRHAGRLLRAVGMRFPDLVAAHARAEIATEAAQELAAALGAAEQRIAELEAENSRGTAVAVWQYVGAKISSAPIAAEWALSLHRAGQIWLSSAEIAFLGKTVPGWRGPLRPKQQAWLQHILDCIVERTGRTPPP